MLSSIISGKRSRTDRLGVRYSPGASRQSKAHWERRCTTKRIARGYASFSTIRAVVFLPAGKLDFGKLNQHVAWPTRFSKESIF